MVRCSCDKHVASVCISSSTQKHSYVRCIFLRSNSSHYCSSLCCFAGRPVQFLLTSWVYAFYWFDYKWSLTNLPLEKRVQFFQSHWAYFAGKPAGLGLPYNAEPFCTSVHAISEHLHNRTVMCPAKHTIVDCIVSLSIHSRGT